VRHITLLVVLLACVACGGAPAVHYRVQDALDCLQRTNSTRGGGGPQSILLLFASPDGKSAIEPAFVTFASDRPSGSVAAALGVTRRDPVWSENRGDGHVLGYGPYEPPIAKREGISAAAAKAAGAALDLEVHNAIDACLKQNER
jgi:hypothetical protein